MAAIRTGFSFRLLLFPFSLIYGLIVFIRNLAFDLNILKSGSFDIPIISVGNLTVGGTGKTPQIEYLIELLKDTFRVAVLSRGYRRETKGYVVAGKKTSPSEIGDEPYQIFTKFRKVIVAVCEKRAVGIENLLNKRKKPDVILLDDAFQHRYVKPGLSILLIDFNRPVFKDLLLPAGNLREGFGNRKRADVVVVTKCPEQINNGIVETWKKKLNLRANQSLFFSSIAYGKPQQLFSDGSLELPIEIIQKEKVKILLVTGIARPDSLIRWLQDKNIKLEIMSFPDHHNYSKEDINKIKTGFKKIKGRKKIILTTEKDAVRLMHIKKIPRNLKHKIYYIPIFNKFLQGKHEEFNCLILNYVKQNTRIG